ncbi:MAG: RND transporter, partial [Oxalobacteraceae bacterium]
MNTMIARGLPSLFAALLLSACSAPAFKQPEIAAVPAFKEAQAPATRTAPDGTTWKIGQPAEAQPRGEWWRVFHDPSLDALVAEAATNNQNLTVAAARVRQARAIAGIAEADRIPQIGVDAGAQRTRLSSQEALQAPGTPVAAFNSYSARLSASYEIDLFGRVSANVAAARLDTGAVEATY